MMMPQPIRIFIVCFLSFLSVFRGHLSYTSFQVGSVKRRQGGCYIPDRRGVYETMSMFYGL